jgi:CDP-glycerol glycerophosphotransferase (TagB/SpsB family)
VKDRLKDLLRRAIRRARVSPNPLMRGGVEFAQHVFRLAGVIAPGLRLGWMSALRDVRWDGDDLVLRGWSFVRGTTHGEAPRHVVYLRRPGQPVWLGGRGAAAATRHVSDRDVLGGSARAELDYSGSTWEARFSAAQLAKLAPGRWDLHTKIVHGVHRSWGPVRNTYVFGTPPVAPARDLGDCLVRVVSVPDGDGAHVDIGPRGIPARSVVTDGRDISIAVPAEFAAELGQAVLRGTKQESVQLAASADTDHVLLTGTLPAGKAFVDPATGVRSPARWSAFTESGVPITVDSNLVDDLVVRRGVSGALEITDVPHMVQVDSVVRDGDQLRLTGDLAGNRDEFDLVLVAARAEIPVTLESVAEGGRFVATAPLRVSSWGGPELPPMRGAYVLEGRLRGKTGDAARFATFVSHRYMATVPTIVPGEDIRLRFELNAQPQLLIRVGRPRRDDEYGAHNQRRLYNEYALGHTEPLDAVYFESFFGRSATCNPRAIDAEVARRRPDLPRYWSVDDRAIAVPDGAIAVVIGTREWWQVRESARWIVTNEWLRARYVKKPFQTVLQTWHGSMYKRIGMDRGRSGFLAGGHSDRARAERANWDMFISQNGDTTPIIQQAYEFHGNDASAVIEIGYPRNDELTAIDPARVELIRERIGIPAGRRVVMYAPTWREANQDVELLSLVKLAKEVGEEITFLQRGHVRTLEEGETVASDAVIDVSTYPQINELYMVADLLITDYSSMMFDYSVTGRPMLFYTPDIEEYTDPKVRGAYFDLEEVAPGPVVRTTPEVVDLLRTIDAWAPTFTERYAAWQNRFNHHDDGRASARAVDALFAFDTTSRRNTQVRRSYEPGAGEEA